MTGLFSIELDAFRYATLGGLNAGIAYLIMARGTGRDNRTTQWSVHSVEQRTGISRLNAVRAVRGLVERGLWKMTRAGKHPIYKAVPAGEIPGCDAPKEPVMVWLPNTLIDGVANEVPPIELIRQTRSLAALLLLIESYAVHFLPEYGGVSPKLLAWKYERVKVGERGQFNVWGFRRTHLEVTPAFAAQFMTGRQVKHGNKKRDAGWDEVFFPAVETLVDHLGLVEPVGMLLDGSDADAEVIHPLGLWGGTPEERELAQAVEGAARALLTDGQVSWADEQGYRLVPVLKHFADVALVEVARLRYRPHTQNTGKWAEQMKQNAAEWLVKYRKLTQEPAAAHRQTGTE